MWVQIETYDSTVSKQFHMDMVDTDYDGGMCRVKCGEAEKQNRSLHCNAGGVPKDISMTSL